MNMKMNQFVLASLAGGLLCVNAHSAGAADSGSGTPGVATQRAVVNFAELARQVAPPAAAPPEAAPAAQARFAPASMGGTPPSPSPASSFLAFNQEQGISYVPDTQGAVGPKHLMVAVNGTLRIQDRLGGVISTVADTNFWANLGIFPGNSTCGPNTEFPIFDPRILYDPFGQRWILTSLSDAITNAASLLIGVSQTSDPTGNWNLYRIYLDSPRQQWMDFDRLGFTKDWIVVCGAMFAGYYLPTTGYQGTHFYVFNKTNLYAGGAGQYTLFQRSEFSVNRVVMPALTYDASVSTLYFLAAGDGPINVNSLQIFTVSGPVGAEVFTSGPTVTTTNRWDDLPRGGGNANVLPQLGTTNKIAPQSAFIRSAIIYRNGSLWAAHHVHLPAGGSPQRTSIQWWQIGPGGTVLQRGLIDDLAGRNSYSYPGIAVNKFNEVLVGYSRFSSNQFPSANFAFRAAGDPPGTLRGDAVLKAGEAPFYVPYSPLCSGNVNRWGDYSATVVDPVNDSDLWTIQEYAATPSGGQDRWGTWWGRVVPPLNVVVTDTTVTEGDAGTTDAVFTASLARTNDQIISVEFATADGSALAGADYVATNGTLVFNPGETNKTIRVVVNGDLFDETNETFYVTLSNPTNITLAYTQAQGTIVDNDPPPAISINDISVQEGDTGLPDATFTLSLSAPSGQSISVRAQTANGSAILRVDYVPTNIVATIPPGATSQPVTIKIIADALIESNETFFVNLSSPTNATIADSQGRCTILDDDFKVTAVERTSGDVRISFTTQTNQTYRVERTESLSAPIVWEPVPGATDVAGTGAVVAVIDAAGSGRPQRFYRVRLN